MRNKKHTQTKINNLNKKLSERELFYIAFKSGSPSCFSNTLITRLFFSLAYSIANVTKKATVMVV